MRGLLPSVSKLSLAIAAIASAAAAQGIDVNGGEQTLTWSGDCNTPVVFKNKTGLTLFDMHIWIGDDDQANPPELGRIVIQNSGGSTNWDVDDNQDGDNDDANENDTTDSTPGAWHRAQARGDGDGIAADATFSIDLCDQNNGNLTGREIHLLPTIKSADVSKVGGDGGRNTNPPAKPTQNQHSFYKTMKNGLGPVASAKFSFALTNDDYSLPLSAFVVWPVEYDVTITSIWLSIPSTFDPYSGVLSFAPIHPGQTVQVWYDLSNLSSIAPTTDIYFDAIFGNLGSYSSYCTSGVSSNGCVPVMSGSGTPSASASSGFTISCSALEPQKTGILFYGLTDTYYVPQPWSSGSSSFLCVKAPTQRTYIQNSGGSFGQCNGSMSIDWNAFITANPWALGAWRNAGQSFDAQCWYRDPLAVKTTNLSDALRFTLAP